MIFTLKTVLMISGDQCCKKRVYKGVRSVSRYEFTFRRLSLGKCHLRFSATLCNFRRSRLYGSVGRAPLATWPLSRAVETWTVCVQHARPCRKSAQGQTVYSDLRAQAPKKAIHGKEDQPLRQRFCAILGIVAILNGTYFGRKKSSRAWLDGCVVRKSTLTIHSVGCVIADAKVFWWHFRRFSWASVAPHK